jgi:hypothetical protein
MGKTHEKIDPNVILDVGVFVFNGLKISFMVMGAFLVFFNSIFVRDCRAGHFCVVDRVIYEMCQLVSAINDLLLVTCDTNVSWRSLCELDDCYINSYLVASFQYRLYCHQKIRFKMRKNNLKGNVFSRKRDASHIALTERR